MEMFLALHIVAALAGVFIFALTYLMRETSEGKWVNRIDEFWIRVDDRRIAAGGLWLSLFNNIAAKLTKIFDRIVGEKLVSLRLIGISGTLSFASLFFFYALFLGVCSYFLIVYHDLIKQKIPTITNLEISTGFLIAFFLVFVLLTFIFGILSLLPMIFKSRFWVFLSCLPTGIIFVFFFHSILIGTVTMSSLAVFLPVIMSLSADVLLTVIIRKSLKWITERVSSARVISAITIQLLLVLITFLFPALLIIRQIPHIRVNNLSIGSLILTLFNLPTAAASMAFIVSLGFLVVYRYTWPVIERLVYPMTRPEVLKKRQLVRVISGALALYGLHGIPNAGWLIEIIKSLNK